VELEQALKLHDDLLAAKPEEARHDSDICQFCVEKASGTSSENPPAVGRSDATDQTQPPRTTEGGTTVPMSDITKETHEALLDKAVRDAVTTTETALAAKVEETAKLTTQVEELTTANAKLDEDNKRLNSELDAAQVAKKTAEDTAEALKKDLAAKDEAAAKAEIASKRTEQIRNLKLFPDEYIQERASSWAEISDEQWTERLDEWAKLKPAVEGDKPAADAASAMTGTTGGLTTAPAGDGKPTNAKRAALGLVG
jgi:hypothetical protein